MTKRVIVALLAAAACGPDTSAPAKPAGTPTDPVDVCERAADVCRLDDSRLGVCTPDKSGTTFTCMSQH